MENKKKHAQKSLAGDYVHMWWPNGWSMYTEDKGDLYFRAGTYAMSWNVKSGSINRIGVVSDGKTQAQAAAEDNETVENMPASSSSVSLKANGVQCAPSAFGSVKKTFTDAVFDYSAGPDTTQPSRIEDSGAYMQRCDIPYITFDNGFAGMLKVAATPRHIALEYGAHSLDGAYMGKAELSYTITLAEKYSKADWSACRFALTLAAEDGSGFTFVSPAAEGRPVISLFGTSVTFTANSCMSFVIIPSKNASIGDGLRFLSVQSDVSIKYARLTGEGTGEYAQAAYDTKRGMHVIKLGKVEDNRAKGVHNDYNRVRFIAENPLDHQIYAPLVFDDDSGGAGLYIVGGAPFLRDAETGEPIGVPVQLSKNWHDGQWYHLYTGITVPAKSSAELEFCMANSKWGAAYAASHSQLSLIGYGNNQLWCESALGCNGESVCYDADKNLNRSNIDDARPFLISQKITRENGETESAPPWNWSGNVGGADFLMYFDADNRQQKLVRMKTSYIQQAPNLTDVSYNGISEDKSIEMTVHARLGRTDDVVRIYYQFNYRFLKDTSYSRLALFQVQADGYNTPGYSRYAIGNDECVLEDSTMPENADGVLYAASANQAIETTGSNPWFYLYRNLSRDPGYEDAGVMFTIRRYEAVINGQTHTQPHYGKISMPAGNVPISFEVALPNTQVIKTGSAVSFTAEYTILGNDKGQYYGDCPYLLELPAGEWSACDMAFHQAKNNAQHVEMIQGELKNTYPTEIQAIGETAHFRLTGGLGYTPVIFTHLNCYGGWKLEASEDNSTWLKVDQSAQGNDYWQCFYDSAVDKYQLIFNVENRQPTYYRLSRHI